MMPATAGPSGSSALAKGTRAPQRQCCFLPARRRAGATSASALELQQSLRASQGEVVRLKAEVVHLNALLAAAHKEAQEQAAALEEQRER